LRKGAFLHYIEFFKKRRCNDYAFSKNAIAFYQISALTAEDGIIPSKLSKINILIFESNLV